MVPGPRPGPSAADDPQFAEDDEDAGFRAEDIPLAQLLLAYERECAASDAVAAAHGPGDTGTNRACDSGAASLRRILLRTIEETARHAGRLDTIREPLDGETGYH